MGLSNEQLTKIWRATARDKLSRDDLTEFHIDDAANALLDSDLTFRVEGHCVYGIAQIGDSKAELLVQDSRRVDENTGAAFREYLAAQEEEVPASKRMRYANQLLDLDVSALPASLVAGNAATAAAAGDISIDNVMRDDAEVALDPAEAAVRSADVAQALDNAFDFDFNDFENPTEEPQMQPLDFGPDLEYSNSPTHTPDAGLEPLVTIGDEESVVVAKSRIRESGVDDVTTIQARRAPVSRILRDLPAPTTPEQLVESDYIALDEATEQLLDPNFVQQEMRRRRDGFITSELPHIENDEVDDDMDMGMDAGMDFDVSFGSDDEDVTEEQVAGEAKRARETVKAALKSKGATVVLSELGDTRAARACNLMEVLHLAARGRVRAQQETAWGPVVLTRM